jgi:hypothetical protein
VLLGSGRRDLVVSFSHMARGVDGIVTAGAALALLLACACGGRTGLGFDDGSELGPDAGLLGPSGDAASGARDGSMASVDGSGVGPRRDSGSVGDDDSGNFFTDDAAAAGDDTGVGTAPDGGPFQDGAVCGPSTCAGCCRRGLCLDGLTSGECALGGRTCLTCDPERTCSSEGKCL